MNKYIKILKGEKVKDKKIITPKINEGLLSGIIRGWIISNFKVHEENITINEIPRTISELQLVYRTLYPTRFSLWI